MQTPDAIPVTPVDPRPRAPQGRRTLQFLVVFVACVLVLDALAGDKGLIETMRARRRYEELGASLGALRRENARLREEARRLREDPRAIEEIARRELGLIRPGELLIVITDAAQPSGRPR